MDNFLICTHLLVKQGHRDWIFTLQWLSDDLLVSGSRDTKVCVCVCVRVCQRTDRFSRDINTLEHVGLQ